MANESTNIDELLGERSYESSQASGDFRLRELSVHTPSNANAVEITPYGAFNYKWSHDENSSGVAYDKLENNGSNIGIDISEPSIEGSTIGAVAKLQVGIDVDDSGSDTFDSQLAYVGIVNNGVTLSVGRQSHPFTDNIGGKTSRFNV